jgi:predicted ATPase/Tfp pilus assembly protein PilF
MKRILTPDQKIRVFVSSTLKELAPEREAAREAITQLRVTPVMYESGARPHPPRELYSAYLDQSDIFLGIYWQEYGWIAPDMTVSGLEDEYNLSGGKPKLIYLKRPASDVDSRLSTLLSRIQNDGLSYKPFSTVEELRALIADDLAQIFTESFEALQVAPEPKAEFKAPTNNLPRQSTAFIGRKREVNTVRALLRHPDITLVTLTGAGGMGKTRLALKVAANVLEDFKDGVWFVELSPILESNLVVSTIAQTLNVKETAEQSIIERLKEYLQDKNLLLVLDTFEHLINAASAIGELLEASPHVKVLVTSREGLPVYGAQEFPVPPLTVPNPENQSDVESVSQYEAVKLFTARAQAIKPAFEVNGHNVQAIAKICYKLEGIPLAIELAAAHIKAMTPQSIWDGLGRRLDLLTGGPTNVHPRHQTLRATIDWSYKLLKRDERRLFQRMSVFRGGCTLEAAGDIGSLAAKDREPMASTNGKPRVHVTHNTSVLKLVTSLVSKSLLRQQEGVGGETRYSMLDTIYEYALEKLNERDEAEDIRKRHAYYYLALAAQGHLQSRGSKQEEWLNRLEEEHDNFRAALSWAVESSMDGPNQDSRAGSNIRDEELTLIRLKMVAYLWPFWGTRGYYSEGREQLGKSLSIVTKQGMQSWRDVNNPDMWAYFSARHGAGILARSQGDIEWARSLHEENLAISKELGDKWKIAATLEVLGILASDVGDYERARSLYEESLEISRELGDKAGLESCLNSLGHLSYMEGDYERGRPLHEESLAISRELGDKQSIASSLSSLGNLAFEKGEHEQARSFYEESLAIYGELGHKRNIADSLHGIANLAYMERDYEKAHSLYEESLAISRELGDKLSIAITFYCLGIVTFEQEDYEQARLHLERSLLILRDLRDKGRIPSAFVGLAAVSLHETSGRRSNLQRAERAARLLGASTAFHEIISTVPIRMERTIYERTASNAQSILGEPEWEAAYEYGRTISMDQAITYALEEREES